MCHATHTPHARLLPADGTALLLPRASGTFHVRARMQLGVEAGYPTVGVAKNLLAVDGLERFDVRAALAAIAPPAGSSRSSSVPQGRAPDADSAVRLVHAAPAQDAAFTAGDTGPGAHMDTGAGAPGESPSRNHGQPDAGGSSSGGGAGSSGGAAVAGHDRCVPLQGDSGAVLGMALCPGATNKPLFVSVGEYALARLLITARCAAFPSHPAACMHPLG